MILALFLFWQAVIQPRSGNLNFDGINDYIDCGNNTSLNAGINDWSIEQWIKVGSNKEGDILAKGNGYRIKITPENKIWVTIEGNDRLQNPTFITCDDTHLYITDTYNYRIVKRLKSDLSYVSKIGSAGSGNDQFVYPQGITCDDTHLYITDSNNHRIVKRLKSDLSYVSKIGSYGSGNDQFNKPRGITCDDTHLYITDTDNHRIVKRLKSDLSYVDKVNSFASSLYSSVLNTAFHYLQVVIRNYNTLELYIDGVIDNSVDISYKYNNYASPENLKIGGYVNYFKGINFIITSYKRALDSLEIVYNSKHRESFSTDSLKLWLKMNECEGDTVFDNSGYGNHGVLLGGTLWGWDSPWSAVIQ